MRTLRELRQAGQIPQSPVLIDSPMALAALGVYQKAIAARSGELRPEIIADGTMVPGVSPTKIDITGELVGDTGIEPVTSSV